jgi:cytochrome c oxidase cbb3-type subunit 3
LIAIEITVSAYYYVSLVDRGTKIQLNASDLSFKDSEWYKKLMAKLTKTEPLESEGQPLDHDYDGIKELDNNLPPWWVYLFYASIVLELFIWFDTKF